VNPSLKTIESHWPLDIIWTNKTPHDLKKSLVFIWTTEDRIVDCQSWDEEVGIVLMELIEKKSLDLAVEALLSNITSSKLTKILEAHLSEWINKGILLIKE